MNAKNKKPEIIVFAGPNGSGKTTIAGQLRPVGMPYIDAEAIRKAILCGNEEAEEKAAALCEAYLAQGRGFCLETELATDEDLRLLERAKEAGYFVRCYCVLTADPTINVARVASRVAAGGENVTEGRLRAHYEKSLARIAELMRLCDVCHIYDNSLEKPFRIFKKRGYMCFFCTERGLWHKADIQALTGVRNPWQDALNEVG